MSRNRREQEPRYHPPYAETKDGKFIHPIKQVFFRGEQYPSTFIFDVDETDQLKDGQTIGHTLDGQYLYWSKLSGVIARG